VGIFGYTGLQGMSADIGYADDNFYLWIKDKKHE